MIWPMKERGQARLPDLETLGLAQLLSRLKPFQRRLPLNSDQLEVRKAGLPPALFASRNTFCASRSFVSQFSCHAIVEPLV
jgi:hypothetical protein